MDRARVRAGWTFAVLLGVELALFRWARGPLRGFVGDLLVVVLLVSLLAAAGAASARKRVLGVGCFAVGVELFQGLGVVPRDAPWWVHLTVGATFDPMDLLAYALGALASFAAERAWSDGPTTT